MSANTDKHTRRNFIIGAGVFGAVGYTRITMAEKERTIADVLWGDDSVPRIGLTEDGPLYPTVEIPWLGNLVELPGKSARAKGETLYLFGQIFDTKGRPLDNASVEIWQTDFNGNYTHPRGWNQDQLDPNFGYFGKVSTNSEGFYVFKTIRPRWYSLFGFPRAAHIHIKMRHRDHGVLTTEAYFQNASHEEIAPKDNVFLSRPPFIRNRIVLPEQSPTNFPHVDIDFENSAICCRYDLAFLL